MKDILYQAFGEGKDLEWWQMTDRAVLIFLLAIALIRLSGRRSFGMKSSFDNTIVILLGGILSRTVTGASPFLPTIAAALALVVMHRLFAWLCLRSHRFGRMVKGMPLSLYHADRFNRPNMKHGLISEHDIREDVRLKANINDMADVESAWLERTGEVSVVRKQKK